MRLGAHGLMVVLVVSVLTVGSGTTAVADPLPGFDFDPDRLAERMDSCLDFRSAKEDVLMGWVKLSTGERRTWRCSSLRHMMRYDGSPGQAHDPSVDVADFMRCVDEVVSYGFPRPGGTKNPGNITLIKQYNGTSSRAIVAVNESTGDIATIYTEPRPDDWTGCAHAL